MPAVVQRTSILIVLAILLAAGCGGTSDADQIRGVLAKLQTARDRHDARTACDELVTVEEPGRPAEEKDGGGEEADAESASCERDFARALSAAGADLTSYAQHVQAVKVHGDRAVAHVRVTATRRDGSALRRSVDYELARRDGGWRLVLHPE